MRSEVTAPRRGLVTDALFGRRLEPLLEGLLALPASQETSALIAAVSSPRFTGSADVQALVTRGEAHVKERSRAATYAVVPPGSGGRLQAAMDATVSRYCAAEPSRHQDIAPYAGHARSGLRTVLELAEHRKIQILIVPSLDHLPPDDPRDEGNPWTRTGIRDRLGALAVRLIPADHDGVLSRAVWEAVR
ncbi:hypothetical protein BX286_6307 [Streptomyces sp. 3211.6]|uniref:hypothetical protein n=1 Tax=Streptomyces sp. 3211.6 TaxID=1938845 RepID=UPI000EB4FACF|nr:hypothetical protein [Streptomyces sp. 3211.6]RKT08223.1 hypothetical protein BX286_6307 [Streptomyces sp. 3211.6]